MRGSYKLQTKKNLYSSHHTPHFSRSNPSSRIPSTTHIFLTTSTLRLLIWLILFPYKYFKYHSCHMPVKILGKLLEFKSCFLSDYGDKARTVPGRLPVMRIIRERLPLNVLLISWSLIPCMRLSTTG